MIHKTAQRALRMESLESRELLTVNPLGYDGPLTVQTDQSFAAESTIETEAAVVQAEAEATSNKAATNSIASATGITSNSATISWTKPTVFKGTDGDIALKGAGNYTLNVSNDLDEFNVTIPAETLKTKTSWIVTGFNPRFHSEYTYTITATLTAKDGTNLGEQVVARGEFYPAEPGDAYLMPAGAPMDLKTSKTSGLATVTDPESSLVSSSTAKTDCIKITWKAPANYTGAYRVTMDICKPGSNEAEYGADTMVTIHPGAKLEAFFALSNLPDEYKDGARLKFTVVGFRGNDDSVATSTYFNHGTVADLIPDVMAQVPYPGIYFMIAEGNRYIEPKITVVLRNLTPGENYTVKIQEVLSTIPHELGDLVATKTVTDIVDGRAEVVFLDAEIPRSENGYGRYEVSLEGSDMTSPVIWDYDATVGDGVSAEAASVAISQMTAVFSTESSPTASSAVKAPSKSVFMDSSAGPVLARINWEAPPEPPVSEGLIAGYLIYIRDSNKAIVDYGFAKQIDSGIWGYQSFETLTPKQSYTAEVYTVTDKYKISKNPLKITFKTAEIAPPAMSISGITHTGARLSLTPGNAFYNEINFDYKYYLQYTSVVDAKGKPDWDTATSEEVDYFSKDFKTQLKPGTQYFARVAVVGKGGNYATALETTVASYGKEIKFKTLDVPRATISKSGFAMDGPDFGFKFSVMTPNTAAAKTPLLDGGIGTKTGFMYEIIVTDGSAKVDKVTGILMGGLSLSLETGVLMIEDSKPSTPGGTKFTPSVSPVVKFTDIQTVLNDFNLRIDGMKTLQFQLKVTYALMDSATGDFVTKPADFGLVNSAYYAETYTKPAKLTMPKWFV